MNLPEEEWVKFYPTSKNWQMSNPGGGGIGIPEIPVGRDGEVMRNNL